MELRLSPAARADLDGIWEYTAGHWGEAHAERYVRDIEDVCLALLRGIQPSRSAEDARAGYRKVAVGLHMIYFRTSSDALEVIRILHQRMDFRRHL